MRVSILFSGVVLGTSLAFQAHALCINPNINPLPERPQKPTELMNNASYFDDYTNKAAYAAFIENSCLGENIVQSTMIDAIDAIYESSTDKNSHEIRFSNFRQSHEKAATFIGIAKRCYISKMDTKSLINISIDKIKRFAAVSAKLNGEYNAKITKWNELATERTNQEASYRACLAQEAEARRIAEQQAAEAKRIAEQQAAEAKRIAEQQAAEAKRIAEQQAAEAAEVAHRRQIAIEAAPEAGRRIVSKAYNGGTNIGTTLSSWSYDPVTKKYVLQLSISWSGKIFSSNSYCADGTVTMDGGGNLSNWNPTYMCQSLKDYISDKRFWGGVAAITLGAIAVSNGSQ